MAHRCRLCGAWRPTDADMVPYSQHIARLYPVLGAVLEMAQEYDRAGEPWKRDQLPELTTAAEFVEWLCFEVQTAAGVTNGRGPSERVAVS